MNGFITDDGYGAIPFGKHLMIIFNNEQLEVVKTRKLAEEFIIQHRATIETGTPNSKSTVKSARVRKRTK